MRKIVFYKLVTASSAIDLTEKVNQAIQEEGFASITAKREENSRIKTCALNSTRSSNHRLIQ